MAVTVPLVADSMLADHVLADKAGMARRQFFARRPSL